MIATPNGPPLKQPFDISPSLCYYCADMSSNGEITVATWNILTAWPTDKGVTPQPERVGSIIDALDAAQLSGQLALSLCEVDSDEHGMQNGIKIAKALNLSKYAGAAHHNANEGVLLATTADWTNPEVLVLDKEFSGRAAVKATIGNVAVLGCHLSHEATKNRWRRKQVESAHTAVADHHGIIMGDLNCLPFQQPRRLLADYGYTSAARTLGEGRPPKTFPTPDYRWRTITLYQQPLVGRGYSLDDIYFSPAMEMIDGGLLRGESDHYGLWAKLRLKQAFQFVTAKNVELHQTTESASMA